MISCYKATKTRLIEAVVEHSLLGNTKVRKSDSREHNAILSVLLKKSKDRTMFNLNITQDNGSLNYYNVN